MAKKNRRSKKQRKACTRCGLCCLSKVCPNGIALGMDKAPCLFLKIDKEGLASCDLIESAKGTEHFEEISKMFRLGTGCVVKSNMRDTVTGTLRAFSALSAVQKRKVVVELCEMLRKTKWWRTKQLCRRVKHWLRSKLGKKKVKR